MDKDAYIKQLEEENTELKRHIEKFEERIEELERLLGMNSKNSSKPPSSDPPGMSAILPRRRRKKRGAKNGHQPHLRELLSPNMVKQHFELKAAKKLLGAFCGTLVSDRWGGHNFFCWLRQICWTHLKTGFQGDQ